MKNIYRRILGVWFCGLCAAAALSACSYRAELENPQAAFPKRFEIASSTTSGEESAEVRHALAFDGDIKTRWASPHMDNQWIMADLGAEQNVIGVRLTWEAAFAEEYKIEASINNEDWKTLVTVRNGDGEEDRLEFAPVKARYVRMYGVRRSTTFGFSLYEFEIWGY